MNPETAGASSKVEELCADILRRRQEALTRRIEAYPRNNPIASDLGACGRETALAILHWQERPLPSPDLKARFERGSLIEDFIIRELTDLGISVRVERRPFEIRDGKGRIILRGKIDGFINQNHQDFPMEAKSLDPNLFRRIDKAEDFNEFGFMAKYPRQLNAYLYAEKLTEGFFLLDDCMGHWKLIPVQFDAEDAARTVDQCEAAVEAVEQVRGNGDDPETHLPPYHPDAAVCRRCWAFGRLCNPPMEFHGLSIMADPEVEHLLNWRAEVEEAHREWEAIEKKLKARFEGQTGLIVGDWLIEGKWVEKHVPAKEAYDQRYWLKKITRTGN